MYLGTRSLGRTVTIPCTTYSPTTGGAADADVGPNYRIYKNGSVTAIATGTLNKIDGDNTTGFYSATVSLSPVKGFLSGKSYTVYIEATVDSVVGTVLHYFKIS
jgi:hypothetical protein